MKKKDGVYEEYYPKGQLYWKGRFSRNMKETYKDGKKDGVWEYYYEDGFDFEEWSTDPMNTVTSTRAVKDYFNGNCCKQLLYALLFAQCFGIYMYIVVLPTCILHEAPTNGYLVT